MAASIAKVLGSCCSSGDKEKGEPPSKKTKWDGDVGGPNRKRYIAGGSSDPSSPVPSPIPAPSSDPVQLVVTVSVPLPQDRQTLEHLGHRDGQVIRYIHVHPQLTTVVHFLWLIDDWFQNNHPHPSIPEPVLRGFHPASEITFVANCTAERIRTYNTESCGYNGDILLHAVSGGGLRNLDQVTVRQWLPHDYLTWLDAPWRIHREQLTYPSFF